MSKSLDECRATIKRVNVKLGHLKRSIDRYHLRSCKVVTDDDLERGERLYRLSEVKEPPLSISIQVTEIACLMRASLDHLMFLILTDANGGQPPEGKFTSSFPTIQDPVEFEKDMAKLCDKRGVKQNVIDWLKSHQGYATPNPKERILIHLNEIAKIAKHRFHNTIKATPGRTRARLSPIQGISEGMTVENNTFNGIGVSAFQIQRTDFEDGAVVARVTLAREVNGPLTLGSSGFQLAFAPLGPISQETMDATMDRLDVYIEPSQQILFGPGSIAEGIEVLSLLKVISGYIQKDILGDNAITSRL